jgi:hypothetical protein
METEGRPDSVEQLEPETTNPITDRDAELTEPGEGFEPGVEDNADTAEAEGPPAHTTQPPR